MYKISPRKEKDYINKIKQGEKFKCVLPSRVKACTVKVVQRVHG